MQTKSCFDDCVVIFITSWLETKLSRWKQKQVVSHYNYKMALIKTSVFTYANSLSTPSHHPCHSLVFSRDHLWSLSEIISGPGSFAVLFGDHLRSGIIWGSGIICGPVQISINLGKKSLRISCIRKIAVTRILVRVFAYLLSFISQILDLFWSILNGVTLKTNNCSLILRISEAKIRANVWTVYRDNKNVSVVDRSSPCRGDR